MALARAQAAELLGQLVGVNAPASRKRLALDQLDDGAAGGLSRAAALGVEARFGDAVALDAHRDADQVAARRAAGGARCGASRSARPARGRVEVLGEDRIDGQR